jgi:hypothetical protein
MAARRGDKNVLWLSGFPDRADHFALGGKRLIAQME